MKRGGVPRWAGVITAVVLFFLHLPILVLIIFSFNASRYSVAWQGFTLAWYRDLASRPDILHGLGASVIVGITSTSIATLLGTLVALALSRHGFAGRRAFEAFIYVPIVTPEIVVGISLLALFALLSVPLGLGTIIIAHVAFNISFVVVVVMARLSGMDRTLEEAALILGADEITTFWKVTVPLLWPGIVAAALLAFTMSFDDYVITSFVAGAGSSTLPLVIYAMVRRTVDPGVNAISTIVVVITTALIVVADRYSRSSGVST